MTQHKSVDAATPGPWYLADSADDGFTVREEASDFVLAVISDGGHVDPQFALDPATIRANAHKMAAADALYEVLEKIEGWLSHFSDASLSKTDDGCVTVGLSYQQDARAVWLPIVSAALASARGERLSV